jgi:hypothetical protein
MTLFLLQMLYERNKKIIMNGDEIMIWKKAAVALRAIPAYAWSNSGNLQNTSVRREGLLAADRV